MMTDFSNSNGKNIFCSLNENDINLGLDRMRIVLSSLNELEAPFYIHVAGTNGKGSVCSFVSSILASAGFKVGLYTSPHIFNVTERFKINGKDIEFQLFQQYVEKINEVCRVFSLKLTYFELLTAVGFHYFCREKCDFVVLETGLGGRLDATNVISKSLALIASISFDHQKFLGNTIPEIASEKAGIIKYNSSVLLYSSSNEVQKIVSQRCREMNSLLYKTKFSKIVSRSHSLKNQVFDFENFKSLRIKKLGCQQARNAAMAIDCIRIIKKHGYRIGNRSMRAGLYKAKWPFRFDVVSKKPIKILDGAHNPESAEILLKNLRTYFPNQKFIFIIGMMADKDYFKVLQYLLKVAKEFHFITIDNERALSSSLLSLSLGDSAVPNYSYGKNIDILKSKISDISDPICMTGSFFLFKELKDVSII